MRVLHVLIAPQGGATVGTLEMIRTSNLRDPATEHFAIYPGLSGDPDPTIRSLCQDCRAIPMRWWNRKVSLGPLRRQLVWAREMQLTHFGLRTRKIIRKLLAEWRIDLVHTNTSATIDGAIVANECGLPHVWHIKERIGAHGFMRFPLTDDDLARRISSLSRVIVPMSRFVSEIFVEHGHAAKTRVVYDGVDAALFDSDEARDRGRALRRVWGIPDSAVFVGKIAAVTSTVKRHELFIRSAAKVSRANRDAYFAIVGTIPAANGWVRRESSQYFDGLRSLVRSEGLEERFRWTGASSDVGAIMNAIDIMAHACDLEGFGRVAIEAMAAGRPVVGPGAGGISESVVDGETGRLFPAGDSTAMAEAIAELAADGILRRRMGEAGKIRARQGFSPVTHLEAIQEVYRTALGRTS